MKRITLLLMFCVLSTSLFAKKITEEQYKIFKSLDTQTTIKKEELIFYAQKKMDIMGDNKPEDVLFLGHFKEDSPRFLKYYVMVHSNDLKEKEGWFLVPRNLEGYDIQGKAFKFTDKKGLLMQSYASGTGAYLDYAFLTFSLDSSKVITKELVEDKNSPLSFKSSDKLVIDNQNNKFKVIELTIDVNGEKKNLYISIRDKKYLSTLEEHKWTSGMLITSPSRIKILPKDRVRFDFDYSGISHADRLGMISLELTYKSGKWVNPSFKFIQLRAGLVSLESN